MNDAVVDFKYSERDGMAEIRADAGKAVKLEIRF